jgi:transcription antitermination factor NusG
VGVKSYLRTSTDEGVDRTSVEQYKDIKRLAAVRNVGLTGVSMAIDVVMYSFYNAAMPLDEVIELRIDSKNLSNLPQSVAIQGKYEAPIRRYLFPLKQWQQTTKVIRKSVEANFRTALKIYKIEIGDKSISEYIEYAWASAAKANGIKIADICACVPSLAEKFDIVPSNLSSRQISTLKRKVANSIVDMAPHWYAIRFIGDDRLVRDELQEAAEGSSVKIYYPLDEICKQVGKKRVFTTKPTIKSIMFVQTSAITIQIISQKRTAESKFIIVRDNATKDKRLAVIPNEQMHKFSMLISNGFDILGDEDMKAVKFEVGDYVNITEGMLKGYNGRVLKITTEGKNDTTVLQIEADSFGSDMKEVLGKHLYISIPESLASKL